MSWVERIENNISITTGDGKVYTPNYAIGSKSVDYNVAEFEFPNIGGTLVKRSEHKGTRYSLELMFQGENNIDDAYAFELSARDKRAWKISHPIYDNITVQPTSMKIDNTGLNVTKVNVDIVETITDDAPKFTQDPKDKTTQDIITQQETAALVFTEVELEPNLSASILDSITDTYSQAVESLELAQDQFDEYTEKFNATASLISSGISDAFEIISAVQDLLMFPSTFLDNVKSKLNFFKKQIETLSADLPNFNTPNEKKVYESMVGSSVMAMVNSSVNPIDETDYGNSKDVLAVIDVMLLYNNLFLTNLDTLQTPNGGDIDSYIPDFESISELTTVMNYSVSQLFTIALGAQQERIVILDADDNVITLTHKFYGLEVDDSTIDEFMRNNNIGLNEMLELKKGREIIYYISG